ncbi:hypothetical protein BMF94_4503 [Rhodotorula taiwanensis]|uniref:Repressor of RNA polymerase III transcription MAF1 n=1 Tax=Rhodotorula taiwanensis TaxID=741276 RepID=A0A2S5B7B7_9BASI|nr:hypothetical protein BMF94_4503 [Rhodotorula taiwanensis]
MKFLEIPELDLLSNALSMSTATLKVTTRIEAFSCKQVSKERKLFKTLDSEFLQDLSLSTSVSPPEHHQGLLDSAFGPLDKPQSRKTLWLLIGLLNVAFPDYDFSRVRPEDFRREPEGPRQVLASLSTALDQLRSPNGSRSFSSFPGISSSPVSDAAPLPGTTPTDHDGTPVATNPFLRQVLDPVIDLADCEVFTYSPDIDSDPHAESDDDDGDEAEDGAFEPDDDGMAFDMDGVDAGRASTPFGPYGSSSSGARNLRRSPMKSISSVFPPGTPSSIGGNDDEYDFSSGGGLLWSSYQFLYNRKLKRIVFINAWARTPRDSRPTIPLRASASSSGMPFRAGPLADHFSSQQLKRSHSNTSVASIPLPKKSKAAAA